MRYILLLCFIYFDVSESKLWPKGVVHFAINPKDYDLHSQDEIVNAFSAVAQETCVKFFSTPLNYNTSDAQKILYVNNPNKQKSCPPQVYNYTGSIVNMVIGYKCINKRDIARMAIAMLKASIQQTASPINSYDLVKRFEEQDQAKKRPTFLTTEDRDYINAHYHAECSTLSSRAVVLSARRYGTQGGSLSKDNVAFYEPRVWPLGIVMYSLDDDLRDSPAAKTLQFAMTQIELATCVIFHEADKIETTPNSLLLFAEYGEDEPELGFKQGEQRLKLTSVTEGAPGHVAHAINNLLRAMGLPMMSNRFDRDNYLNINWQHVQKGKERLLEKMPKEAWVIGIPYDFASATHAPANYLCGLCSPGQHTVQPLQDFMWKRSLDMGHHTELSESDRSLIGLIYDKQCKDRQARTE